MKQRDEDGLDKPAYARGEEPKPQAEEPPLPNRSTVQLEEALDGEVAQKLLALRQALEPQEQPAAPAPQRAPKKSGVARGAKRAPSEDDDVSFEELLNPRDEEVSFEALLEQSKLDWHFFKGDD